MQYYDIYRFSRNRETGKIRRYLQYVGWTLEQAQTHCSRDDTKGKTRTCDWFDCYFKTGHKFY